MCGYVSFLGPGRHRGTSWSKRLGFPPFFVAHSHPRGRVPNFTSCLHPQPQPETHQKATCGPHDSVSEERPLSSFEFCRASDAQQMCFVNFTEQAPLGKAAFLFQGQKRGCPGEPGSSENGTSPAGFLPEHTGRRSPPGANLLTFQAQCAAAWLIPTSPLLVSVPFVMEPGHFIVLITEFSLQRKSEEPEGGFCKFNLQSSNHACDFVFRPGYQAINIISAGVFQK